MQMLVAGYRYGLKGRDRRECWDQATYPGVAWERLRACTAWRARWGGATLDRVCWCVHDEWRRSQKCWCFRTWTRKKVLEACQSVNAQHASRRRRTFRQYGIHHLFQLSNSDWASVKFLVRKKGWVRQVLRGLRALNKVHPLAGNRAKSRMDKRGLSHIPEQCYPLNCTTRKELLSVIKFTCQFHHSLLVRKFKNVSSSLFRNDLPIQKDVALNFNKREFLSLKDALCQVLFKLAQWCLRRGFLNVIDVFSLFRNYLPSQKGVASILTNLKSLHPKMICTTQWHTCNSDT